MSDMFASADGLIKEIYIEIVRCIDSKPAGQEYVEKYSYMYS